MKKVLAVALVVAMLASLTISASAAPAANGTGAIVFNILPPGVHLPPGGSDDPTPPGTLPPGISPGPGTPGQTVWPPWSPPLTGTPAPPIIDMQNSNLHFGNREMPSGTPGGFRGWASYPGAAYGAVTAGGPTVERQPPAAGSIPIGAGASGTATSDRSLLGLLWNQGLTGTSPGTVPVGGVSPTADWTLSVGLGQIHMQGLPAVATMDTFRLRLIPYGTPGFHSAFPVRPAPAPTSPAVPGVSLRTPPAVNMGLIQGANATTPGATMHLADFQSGFVGLQFAGVLEGTWTGTNVVAGEVEVQLFFTVGPRV